MNHRGTLFWCSAAAGWAIIGWGLRGALHHHVDTRPAELARFFVAGPIVHDLLFAPAVLIGGVLVAKLVPARARAFVQAGLLLCGTAVLFAYPEIRGYAHALHNPTSLPHNYTVNAAIVVAVVVAAVFAISLTRARAR